ncbi:hypothetical protein AUC68_10710 [Methyloceanibacter methanicus]|uniref:Uncharacterized protein n=1 Tax=Methyloceanibacter methanicus TaxID=1774968 RepID=A0A1E3VYH9_9HYPH|nr:hypothetical protein AUC68_10710 [Methyloceanibacter methanicus]
MLFVGFLVAIAYGLTTPPQPETAFSANETLTQNDKPLLTSWGPTLGSLRDGVGVRARTDGGPTQTATNEDFHKYGPKTELWLLGQSNGFKDPADAAAKDQGWTSDGYVETAALAATAQAAKPAVASDKPAEAKKPHAMTVATADHRNARAKPRVTEPVIDRIAAARPPQQRRGLFARTSAPQRAARPHVGAREAQPVTRNRGLFARLKGRGKQPQRVWALGPAR